VPTSPAPVSGGNALIALDGVNYDAAPAQLSAQLQDPNTSDQTLVVASLSGDLGTRLAATSQANAGVVYRADETPASIQPSLGSACFIQRAVTNQNFRVVPGPLTTFLKDSYGYVKLSLTSPAVGLLLLPAATSAARRRRNSRPAGCPCRRPRR
jgi:hypothetical protein